MSGSETDLRELAKSAMVERVARALCEAEGMNPNNWRHKVKAARAAIEALTIPSPLAALTEAQTETDPDITRIIRENRAKLYMFGSIEPPFLPQGDSK